MYTCIISTLLRYAHHRKLTQSSTCLNPVKDKNGSSPRPGKDHYVTKNQVCYQSPPSHLPHHHHQVMGGKGSAEPEQYRCIPL